MKKKKRTIGSLIVIGMIGLALWGQQTFFSPSEEAQPTISASESELARLSYDGTQTIEVNHNQPTFSEAQLSIKDGAWARYGELDTLNRATSAEAMLNQSLMPTEKRGDISSVKPTGWHSKELPSGSYLYNRTHLIGFALAGENANWKNLITGTSQLNNPEMLRFEMDINHYLKQDADHYVRYAVTPIYRGDELVAHGVHMQAQSIGDETIQFNIYIFNIQDGVTINYQDGTSRLSQSTSKSNTDTTRTKTAISDSTEYAESSADQVTYVDQQGNGLIKGSKSGIYHLPGSAYYEDTTNPKEWFKTIAEAKAAGYRAPK
ncbi:DNA/RNA non-specific endonuclease [Enterococcus sp. DIV0876]|uniref:DNA/RNA non-specific endonuclease n=1 Tax=Enterococcus sp. DIV0876 TaxID=2774633 RepID=UPI003D2FADDA